MYGFKRGPIGLLKDDYIVLEDDYVDKFRNTGGFDIIGSGRDKLETVEQFETVAAVCKNVVLMLL